VIITLNTAEQKLARYLAAERQAYARKNGVKDCKIGTQSGEETDLEGIAAEIAFAKMHNCYPDLEIGHRPPDDCMLHSGRSVDVKATRHAAGKLIAVRWKTESVDSFALMIGSFPSYRFAGMMTAKELLSADRLGTLPGGKVVSYLANQSELAK